MAELVVVVLSHVIELYTRGTTAAGERGHVMICTCGWSSFGTRDEAREAGRAHLQVHRLAYATGNFHHFDLRCG